MTPCRTCEMTAQRDIGTAPLWDCIYRSQFWDVVHSYNTALPGWLVVVARRHIEALHELTDAEALELGLLMRQTSVALQAVTGCRKTYVMQFAEAAEHPHVHFHIVPRMADQPEERRSTKIFAYLGVSAEACVREDLMNEIAAKIQPFLHTPNPTGKRYDRPENTPHDQF